MKKIDWLYAGISLLILFLLAAIPKMQFKYDIWLYFPTYFLLTLLIIHHKKRPPVIATIAVISGFLVPDIVARLLEGFRDSFISIPRLVFQMLACLTALCFYRISSKKKIVLLGCSVLATGLYIHLLQQYWFNFSDYGSFTGKVEKTKVYAWHVKTANAAIYDQDRYANKIVLFDFWTTSCAVCFKKFPELEKLYRKYGTDTTVIIEAVNVPLPRDSNNMAFTVMSHKPYSFPVVIGLNNIDSAFGVEVYPTTIVMHNGEIMYRGNIEGAGNMITELHSGM